VIRHRRALLAAAACTAFARAARAAPEPKVTAFDPPVAAPPLELLRSDGTPLGLGDLAGRVVLVNFWATWCEPCVAEMPALEALRTQLAPRFEVLGVNFKEGPARIDAFVAKTGVRFPIVRDTDGAVAAAWQARVFPSSFLVRRDGRIALKVVGEADWTSAAWLRRIRALL
jgi:thiol-disulfide isomerase/thioredoxin